MIINEFLSAFAKTNCSKTFPERSKTINNDLSNTLKPMDVLLYRFGGKHDFIGGVISHFTNSPYSHAGLHLKNGYSVEALDCGVSYVDVFSGHRTIDVFRLKKQLTREQRLIMFAKAAQSVLEPYDYIDLTMFPFINKELAAKLSGNHAFICSELVAWIYKEAGIDLVGGKPEAIEAPADLGYSDLLEYIGTFVDGKKKSGYKPNEFNGEEQSWLSVLTAEAMGLFSMKDEFYKGLELNRGKMLND